MAVEVIKASWKKEKSFIDTFSEETLNWVKKASIYMEDVLYPEWSMWYEEVQLYMWRRKAQLAEQWQLRRHNEKYPLTLEQFRRNSGIFRKIDYTKLNVEPLFPKYAEHAEVYQMLMKHTFSRWNNKQSLQYIVDEALLNGNWYWYISRWEKEYKIPKNISKWLDWISVSYETIKEYWVDIDYVSAFDILLDTQVQSNKYRQRWYRKFMSLWQILKEYEDYLTKDKIDKIKQSWNIINNDWNRVKNISMYSSEFNKKCNTIANSVIKSWDIKYWAIDTSSYLSINKNDLFEVVTVYAEGIDWNKSNWYEVIIIRWVVIYAGLSQLPFEWSPIVDLQFFMLPWASVWQWISQLVRPHQKQADTVSNLWVDNLVMALAPMFEIDKQIWKNQKTFTMYPWKIVERSMTWQGIDKINIWDASLSQRSIQATQQIQWYADRWLWLTWGGKIERVKDWVLERKAEADNKNAMFIDNLNIFISDIAMKASLLTKVHAPDKYTISLLEWWATKYKEIEKKDIYNTFKITLDTDWISNSKVEQNINDINLINSLAPLLTDASTWSTRIDIDTFVSKILDRQNLWDLYLDMDKRKEKIKENIDLTQYIKDSIPQEKAPQQWSENVNNIQQQNVQQIDNNTVQDWSEKTYQELVQ